MLTWVVTEKGPKNGCGVWWWWTVVKFCDSGCSYSPHDIS